MKKASKDESRKIVISAALRRGKHAPYRAGRAFKSPISSSIN